MTTLPSFHTHTPLSFHIILPCLYHAPHMLLTCGLSSLPPCVLTHPDSCPCGIYMSHPHSCMFPYIVSRVGQFHLNTSVDSDGGGHSGNSDGKQEFRAPIVSAGRSVRH